MKRVMQVSALGVLGTALLASCGSLVGGLVPPVPVNDPFALNGAVLTSSPLQPATVSGNATVTRTFNNISFDGQGLTPSSVLVKLGFTSIAVTGCTLPATFNVAVRQLKLDLTQPGGPSVSLNFPDATLTVNNNGGNLSLSNPPTPQANFADVVTALGIATGGAQPNTATLSARFEASDNLQNCTVAVGLNNTQATFSNFR